MTAFLLRIRGHKTGEEAFYLVFEGLTVLMVILACVLATRRRQAAAALRT